MVSHGLDNGDGGGTAANGQLESGEVDYSITHCSVYGFGILSDINPGAGSSGYYSWLPVEAHKSGDWVYFYADNGINGTELWKTDGTQSGTQMVKDINPGTNPSINMFDIQSFATVGSTVFFTASDGTNGRELWKTDGTESGTSMVKDIRSGSLPSDPIHLFPFGDEVLFWANSGEGYRLWKSDGTSSGTSMLLNMGGFDSCKYNNIVCMAEAGSSLFFIATDYDVYEYDGSSTTRLTTSLGNVAIENGIHTIGDYVYFKAADKVARTDGSTTETITSSFNQLFSIISDGTYLYFAGEQNSNDGVDLFMFDPSDSSTTQLTTIGNIFDAISCNSVRCGNVLAVMGDLVLITGMNPDEEGDYMSESALWAYNTSSTDYQKITNTASGGWDDVRDLHVFGSTLYFTAESDISGSSTIRQLFTSNGTLSGTALASSDLIFGTYEYIQPMLEIDGSIITWAYAGDAAGREIVYDQAVLTTISYSY